jgi:hypothetical protein
MPDESAREREFLRHAVEHLDDKAKSDLKVALYGSSFFLALSLVPYGRLEYASLIVSAIDLWYFMSWGNDQLRLMQHRDALKLLEGPQGLEHLEEAHPNFGAERFLYYGNSAMIFALFVAALALDWHAIQDRLWRAAYFALVVSSFLFIVAVYAYGARRRLSLSR